MARIFTWLATGGGAWSLAANWNDLTDGIAPSLLTPGAQDIVGVAGPTGSTIQTMTTQGNVLEADFAGNTAVAGSFTVATLTLGQSGSGGLLEVASGMVSAGTATVAAGSLLASGTASAISVTGQLTVGAGQSGLGATACNLDVTAGAAVRTANLVLNASSASIYVDPASSLEVGTIGGAAPGTLTIDAGATLSGQGNANGYGSVTNGGTILAAGGGLILGAVGGTGVLQIGAASVLDLNGATGAGQSVQFTGAQGTLALSTEFDAPQGTISLFAPGDAIDVLGSPISAATYRAAGGGLGILTLWYGGQIADQLTLAGAYAGNVFLTAGDGGFGTLITVAPQTQGGGNASPGTDTPDQYQWIATGGGNWLRNTNWTDLTAGQNPAHIAPGINDLVTIAASDSGSFAVIAGPANAAALTVEGDVALTGTFAIGTLTIGDGTNQITGVLDLLPKDSMAADTVLIADGEISVSGSAVLTVAGTLAMGGGGLGVGLPVTQLSVTAGGTVSAASLTLGGGSGDSITTDPTGVIEIGTAGDAAAGALTVDAGANLGGNGSINPFGAIVDNGTIAAAGGILTLGGVTGGGLLSIGANAGLELIAGNAMAIGFAGTGGILLLANELVSLTGTIAGFGQGDAIDIENDPITGSAVDIVGGNTVLSLYYGSTLVNRLTLAGTFSGSHFVLAPDGASGTDILLSGNGGGGGGGGQGNTDLLTWATPGSGAWNSAGNWFDATTNAVALAPPGAQNAVQIVGPAGIAIQSLGGPGLCASAGFWNNTQLSGSFITGTLSIGGTLAGTLATGLVQVNNSASLTATTQAAVLDGTLAIGVAGLLSVAGTLSMGDGAPGDSDAYSLLSVSNNGTAQLAALALGGGAGAAVQTDATGVIEVGNAGEAASGAVTVDSGAAISGTGYVNLGGLVVDNGRITAAGGTLVVGAVSGIGKLAIAAEAVLALTAVETCPVIFVGGGATLLLPGSEETPAAPIYGFGAGDAIVTGSSQVSNVVWSPGAGSIGTLTLYNGGSVAGTLLLGGDYSGEVFSVQPDGAGSEINVQASAGGGPSQGTPTPDSYLWVGGSGTGWNNAANWQDVTAGQNPAAVAPGSQDLDTVQGATAGGFTTIVGPANAAALTLFGNVALAGIYTIGTLAVGGAGQNGVLALGQGAVLATTSAAIQGGVALQGGGFSTSATLTVDGGDLVAGRQAAVQAGGLVLAGVGAVVTVDSSSTLEVGAAGGAAAGFVTVDAGSILSGAGALNPTGSIFDAGTITASGGTLTLGAVSGSGTLLVGVGATLALDGTADASLLVDFAGPGTLSALTIAPAAEIADFGDGDQIFLPVGGVTDTEYAPTAPNLGVLTLLSNGSVLATLDLVGVGAGQSFAATASGGGTVLTTQTTDWGGGGGVMRNVQPGSASGTFGIVQDYSFWANMPAAAQNALAADQAQHGNEAWIDTSPDGALWDDPAAAVANFAVVSSPTPHSIVGMPVGYNALLAQGYNPVWLTDGGAGDALLVGNHGNDTISGAGQNDTLVASGGNTLFFANYAANIHGAGNDTIITGQGNSVITTSQQGRSVLFLGPAANNVVSQGRDLVLAAAGPGANDTIWAAQSDTIFAASVGLTTIITGNGPSAIIGNPAQLDVIGGNGNGSVVFCNSSVVSEFKGGAGSALVVGGSGYLSVQGGAGAVTVFGGSGANFIEGAAGPSFYLVGEGASTVSAASGNHVWLVGAANDSLVASGGNIVLWGANSAGNNVLQAGNGPVTMSGGFGNDTLIGGSGAAEMLGGSGNDVFSFTHGLSGGSDTIGDFNAATDRIQLHGYAGYNSAVVGGSEVITMSDGTHIQLTGMGSLAGVTITLG